MSYGQVTVPTASKMEMIDITSKIDNILNSQSCTSGILYLFNPHTTAGLTINEGADPDVCRDIIKGLRHIVPETLDYRHMEGNSPSHLMALLTGSSLTILIENGRPVLGTWQKVFFCEFDGPRNRKILWKTVDDIV
ncbi:MAG: secondary thiamine-phosphate synthase enzyme YjbQ [Desulforhopalus sp.]